MILFKSRIALRGVVLASLLSLAVGCSSTPVTNGTSTPSTQGVDSKKVTLLFSFKSGNLDPFADMITLRAGITETLVRLNANLELEPWLATRWTAKDDKTWVFTIRDGVTFQDGSKVDAAAVKASFERGIASSKALNTALKIESMSASGMELEIKTKEPYPALPSELVNPTAVVIQAQAAEKMGAEAFNKAPIGTGPFKVKQFTPNAEIVLEANETYWAGKPKLKEAVFRFNEDPNVRAMALQTHEADIAYHLPAEMVDTIRKKDGLSVESIPSLRTHFLLYNYQKPLMNDMKVRKALNALLDKSSFVKTIMLGNAAVANGPFNGRLPFGSQELDKNADGAEAERLLSEAGIQRGSEGKLMKDGKPLTLELITYKSRPELPLISQLVQSEAAKIGLTIQIKVVESVDSYLANNKDWDLATYSNLTAPRGDGGYFLNSAFIPEGALNLGKVNAPALNAIIGQLNGTSDQKARIQLTKDAVQIINRDALQSYAIHPNVIVGISNRVTNWRPGADEYYILTNEMDVK